MSTENANTGDGTAVPWAAAKSKSITPCGWPIGFSLTLNFEKSANHRVPGHVGGGAPTLQHHASTSTTGTTGEEEEEPEEQEQGGGEEEETTTRERIYHRQKAPRRGFSLLS
eukprot:SAG11_NODE_2362_length_3460_cov_2.653675_1_plen_111_part_10